MKDTIVWIYCVQMTLFTKNNWLLLIRVNRVADQGFGEGVGGLRTFFVIFCWLEKIMQIEIMWGDYYYYGWGDCPLDSSWMCYCHNFVSYKITKVQ